MGKGVIESALNDFRRGLGRRDTFVRRRGSCGAAFQGHPFDHAINAFVVILMRRSILLVLIQIRPSPHGPTEDGPRRSSDMDGICHGGHQR